jgi:diaminopimelate epimerase
MRIWKLHALGNNFVTVLHDAPTDYPKLAERLCRRDISVGADGLLSLDLASWPPMVRMWNPDGTPDFCGNGLCCAAHLTHFLTKREVTLLQTPLTSVPVSVDGIDGCSARVKIRIRRPTFDPEAIPLSVAHGPIAGRGRQIQVDDRVFQVIPSSNGNIHTVLFVDELPTDEYFEHYSPRIETHPLFPHKTNVLWCLIEDEKLHMRIWERSCGETFSCGTGAAAAVAICEHAGYALPPVVEVVMRGGISHVSLTPDGVELATRATLVFEGEMIGQARTERRSGEVRPMPSIETC